MFCFYPERTRPYFVTQRIYENYSEIVYKQGKDADAGRPEDEKFQKILRVYVDKEKTKNFLELFNRYDSRLMVLSQDIEPGLGGIHFFDYIRFDKKKRRHFPIPDLNHEFVKAYKELLQEALEIKLF